MPASSWEGGGNSSTLPTRRPIRPGELGLRLELFSGPRTVTTFPPVRARAYNSYFVQKRLDPLSFGKLAVPTRLWSSRTVPIDQITLAVKCARTRNMGNAASHVRWAGAGKRLEPFLLVTAPSS